MAADRVFPPSHRRLALARRSGLHAASPILVGAIACVAVVLVLFASARAAIARLGALVAAACRGDARALGAGDMVVPALELVAPLLGGCALAAIVAHVAQTRAAWLPRRRIDGAPALDAGPGARVREAAFELARAAAIAGVVLAWLWLVAPRLARLPVVPLAAAAMIASLLATLAIAWIVAGVVDALLRHASLGRALRMTAREQREDQRLASGDPRMRQYRSRLAREPRARDALAGATLLLLGDDAAVAIAWDPVQRPVPVRTATGRGPRATQLLGLARRYRVPVHREPALVTSLAGSDGPVPERHWPRLAEIIAAVRRHA